MALELVSITLADARRFIAEHHSHSAPPIGWRFGVGVIDADRLVAVGVAGRPVARYLDSPDNIEITRVATDGTRMACSMVYAHLCAAARHLGYRTAYTYTLVSECATCPKAAGFTFDADSSDTRTWNRPRRPRLELDLFGNRPTPPVAKLRWARRLTRSPA